MKELVEHVKRAVIDGAYRRQAEMQGLSELLRFQRQSMEDDYRGRDAIRATLEHLRDNQSHEMIAAGWAQLKRAHLPRLGAGPGLQEAFRAMISKALDEMEAGNA